ncbi:beta-N-acetylhexosaminidase [Rhodanobacter denitrificans]|uniref:beta-N-acetylhexosaminidase n=1 Tax=Rhodanobacter denitrificans TaxID=666685 RepID=UPI000260E1DC|nr:beta-N-acetylhexosaminidase [Rhodanobacter denitrificans]EIM01986.1 beta-hexosaminidase [Rhodanobacter denitrificans]UJM88768.1 beta-N-acetylhexosaminidase [Rhodanobacter denitrificans]
MLMIGVAGLQLAEHEKRWLRAAGVAGVLLFARNYASREQLIALCEAIREAGGDDLLIAVDQEGGPVQRFRDGFTRLPPLAAIGAVYDRDPAEAVRLAEEHAWVMASELRASGVDFSFAPVVDLARGNAAIGLRAFHADPAVTAELGQAYVRGMHLGGMAAALKHFPGHGSVATDTHKAPAIDRRSLAQIRRDDLLPFAECIDARVEAVMMAHVTYPAVDSRPAGYSKVWIEQILRGELGFAGAVVSDDISMAAAGAAGSVGERVRAHLDAGCDLVLACFPEVVDEAIAALPADASPVPPPLAALRGSLGSSWAGLLDNPQRDRFVARITALHVDQGTA